jgi:hypothetical protein
MTVAELIAKLKYMPQDAEVSVRADGDFCVAAIVYKMDAANGNAVAVE